MSVIKQLEDAITPLLDSEKMELVDLQYVTESGKKIVRAFIDKEGGVTLADCERMSGMLGERLDNSELLPSSYVLEVSSPGMDRVLKKEKDFNKFAGRKVKVSTYAPVGGQRNFIGKIAAYRPTKLILEDSSGKIIEIEHSNMARARLEPDI